MLNQCCRKTNSGKIIANRHTVALALFISSLCGVLCYCCVHFFELLLLLSFLAPVRVPCCCCCSLPRFLITAWCVVRVRSVRHLHTHHILWLTKSIPKASSITATPNRVTERKLKSMRERESELETIDYWFAVQAEMKAHIRQAAIATKCHHILSDSSLYSLDCQHQPVPPRKKEKRENNW